MQPKSGVPARTSHNVLVQSPGPAGHLVDESQAGFPLSEGTALLKLCTHYPGSTLTSMRFASDVAEMAHLCLWQPKALAGRTINMTTDVPR